MTSQAGPITRQFSKPSQLKVPGYPQNMLGMVAMDMSWMGMIEGRREAAGMRAGWSMGIEGFSTVVRVLPPELYDRITTTSEPIPPNTSSPWGPGDAKPMRGMDHSKVNMD